MTRLITAVVFVIAAISVAAQTTAPASSAATAIIRGRVVGADGRPVKQVVVRVLGATARMQRGSLTDENGRFELKDLVADTYTISINRSGYFTIDPVRRRTIPGKRVTIGDGEVLERVEVVAARTSAIEGRVTDEDGEPIEGADVQPMQVRFVNGHRQLMEGARPRRTNDLGQFRLYGVEPGEYVIVVQPPTAGVNRLPGYPLTYFPGTPAIAEAQVVTVSIGRDAQNVDVRLSPGRVARISGIALTVDGRPLTNGLVLANSQRSGGLAGPPRTVPLQADGSFEIAGVGPGEYVLQSRAFMGDQQSEFASAFLSVGDEDIKGVTLRALAGSTVTGRITVEDDTSNVKPSAFRIWPVPSDFDLAPIIGNGYRAPVNPDWTFSIKGLYGPLFFRLGGGEPDGWMIKSVRSGATDVTDTPLMFGRPNQLLDDLEIVVTNRAAAVTGSVSDARGQPIADYAVILFAVDNARWFRESRFLKYAIAQPDGSFSVRGLPAAEYFVAAIDWMQPSPGSGEWQDPEILEALAQRATRVTLRDGQRVQLALKLVPR
jgi:hypothetical protein